MNKYLRMFFIWVGLIIAFSTVFLVGNDVVVGEQLCVDGRNNINLEGIMCEKSEIQVYGFSQGISILIMFIQMGIGFIIFAFALGRKDVD